MARVTYGDTDVLRRRADQLREQAVDIRTMADSLVAGTESVAWRGRAAASMRDRVTDRASHLRAVAADHDGAAQALDRHIVAVDSAAEAIARIERRANVLVTEARNRVAAARDASEAGLTVEPHADDVVLAAFAAPPPGHRDWLTVELPDL